MSPWINSHDDDDGFDYVRLCSELDLLTEPGRQASEAMWAQRQVIIEGSDQGKLVRYIRPVRYVGKHTKIIGRVYPSQLPAVMMGTLERTKGVRKQVRRTAQSGRRSSMVSMLWSRPNSVEAVCGHG